MSNAIVPVVPKRNATIGAGYPTSLVLGELAVNTTTGDVYLGADPGVVQIGVALAAGTYLNIGTGDGTTVAFTIAGGTGTAAGGYLVSVGGVDQPSGWSVVGTTLTFTEAPPASAEVSVRAILKGTGGGGSSNATQLQGRNIASTAPVDGQLLAWNATANEWRPFGHMYPHGTYWSDDETLINGSYLFVSPLLNTPAANVNFMEGDNNITTNGSGVVTVTQIVWYADSSNYNNAIALSGTISQGDAGGGVKYAIYDGASYIDATISQAVGTDDFTFETFVFSSLETPSTTPTIMDWRLSSNNYGPCQNTNGEIRISDEGFNQDTGVSAYNAWHHFAIVRTGGNRYYYVDGQLNASTSDSGNPLNSGTMLVGGNKDHSGYDWNGHLAGVRLSNVARYTGAFTVPTTRFTADANSLLILNFGATNFPTV